MNLLKEKFVRLTTDPCRLIFLHCLYLFCFNIRQHGHQILYFKLHVDGHRFHYGRLAGRTAAGCAPFLYSISGPLHLISHLLNLQQNVKASCILSMGSQAALRT